MATNFNENAIISSGGFRPSSNNTPLDIRTRVETETDILSIPMPYVGMIVYVLDVDKQFIIRTLKDDDSGLAVVPNALVDTYEELPCHQQIDDLDERVTELEENSGTGGTLTRVSELENDLNFQTKTQVDNAILNATLGEIENVVCRTKTKNLFDENQVTYDSILVNGQVQPQNTGWKVSGLIEVEPNTQYILSRRFEILTLRYSYFLDADGNGISQIEENPFTTPANCKYVRFSIQDSVEFIQVEEGNEFGYYIPYGYEDEYREILESPFLGKKYCAIGDSITIAYLGYPARLARKTGMVLTYNNGVSGTTVTGDYNGANNMCGTTRIEATPVDSEVIVIMAGVNDFNQEKELGTFEDLSVGEDVTLTRNTFYGCFKLMLNRLYTRCPNAQIFIVEQLYTDLEGEEKANTLDAFREATREIAYEYGYPFIATKQNCGFNEMNSDIYLNDGLHPSETGHERVADVIKSGMFSLGHGSYAGVSKAYVDDAISSISEGDTTGITEGSILEYHIADEQVSPGKTTFFDGIESKNIFDENWEVGSINSLGVAYADATRQRSVNFTEVEASTQYTVYRESTNACEFMVYFYNEEETFLSQARVFSASSTAPTVIITPPENCTKIKFRTDNFSIGNVHVEKGNAFTEYAPMGFKWSFKEEFLPEEITEALDSFNTDEQNDRIYALERRIGFKWKEFDTGKIIFMTDDTLSDISVITEILMDEYDFPMSYACITNSLTNAVDENSKGWDTVLDVLQASQEFGGEVWSHSINSNDFSTNSSINGGYNGNVPDDVVEYALKESKRVLKENGLKVNGFVSPRGVFCDDYFELVCKYYRYAYRGSSTIDPYVCARVNIKQHTLNDLKTMIDNAASQHTILILMAHNIPDVDGEGAGIYPNGYTLNNLRELMDYLKYGTDGTKTTPRTDIEVTTMRDIYNQYGGI